MKKGGGRTNARRGAARPSPKPGSARAARTRSGPASARSNRSRPKKNTGRAGAFSRLVPRSFFNWRVIKALLLIAAFVAGGAGLGAGAKALWSWVTHSPRLAIQEISIQTGPRVPEQEVRMLSDLSPGDNILGFRLSDCVEAIEIHPWVKRASVMRELPDRVTIEVKEREPVAVIALGPLYYVDRDGEIFKKVLIGEAMDYPVLTGISLLEAVEDKERVDSMVGLGLQIIGLAHGSRLFPEVEISEVHLDRDYGATVVRTSDAMRIRFGQGEFEDKWYRLERALVELSDEVKKVYELDLNYEGRVTVRLREGYRVASAEPESKPPEGL